MRARWLWVLAMVAAAAAAASNECSAPTVTVAQGQVCGATAKEYVKYIGIPYAEPPSGNLRFKNPVAKRPWQGVLPCTKHCDKCLQAKSIPSTTEGSEDCLCLNVYVPKNSKTKDLPVMAWIHGGAFVSGSGDSDKYDPVFLVAQNIMVVTMNYRLGTMGFLNLGTSDAPGNQGLKDIVMALNWVKDNIKSFGGDPAKVTIFGESAGAVAVHMLTLSPMSKGLFSRAIAQSGSALNPWAFDKTTTCSNTKLLKIANCPLPKGNDTSAAIECLRRTDGRVLQASTSQFACPEENKSGGMMAFTPSLDGEFLLDEPINLAAECKGTVPMIVGYTSAEGILSLTSLRQEADYDTWTKNVEGGVGLEQLGINCSLDAQRLSRWGTRAKQFFLGGKPLTKQNIEGAVSYSTLTSFTWGINLALDMRVKCPAAKPQYLYLFDVDTVLNYFKQICLYGIGKNVKGAAHADELSYLFNFDVHRALPNVPEVAKKSQKRMTKLWTNFAKYGNPTPQKDNKVLTCLWAPYSPKNKNYLLINNKGIHEATKPFANVTRFYEELIRECQ